MRLPVAFVVLMAALAGCADPDSAPLGQVDPEASPAPLTYNLLCPGSKEAYTPLCSSRIESDTESNQEPFVAVHPKDPQVIAIGVNAGHTTEGVSDHGGRPGFDLVRLDIFFTTDGGVTWARSTLPYVADPAVSFEPLELSVVGDPALAFDDNGTLHVSGIASHSRVRGYNVFYTQTPDLGASWSQPEVLSTGDDNDRNWLNLGPDGTIYVPWQRIGAFSEVAWSQDGGTTWRVQSRDQVAHDCITISEMAFLADGTPTFACTLADDFDWQVAVYAFDPETGGIQQLAQPAKFTQAWPRLVAAGGLLVLLADDSNGPLYAISEDGTDWTPARPLPNRDGGRILWQASDPWGMVHLLVQEDSRRSYEVFDPVTDRQRSLNALPAAGSGSDSATLAPTWGDHFWGLHVTEHGGAAAWTRNGGLDVALIEPADRLL